MYAGTGIFFCSNGYKLWSEVVGTGTLVARMGGDGQDVRWDGGNEHNILSPRNSPLQSHCHTSISYSKHFSSSKL